MLELGTLKITPDDDAGCAVLINNGVVDFRVAGVTSFKDGRITTSLICGVLIGQHEPSVGGIPLHVAHH
eukprot:2517234-Pleurochrysis_carterae.AAC.1